MAGYQSKKKRHRVPRLRSGVAVVETAVTLPLIVLFVVAMIQFVNMIFLRQKVTSACYIGMQQLSQLSATESSVYDAIDAILTTRGVTGATIEILCLKDGQPLVNQFVMSGRESGGKDLPQANVRTDKQGIARIKLNAAGKWYVKFINMTRLTDPKINYESKWATLTFALK